MTISTTTNRIVYTGNGSTKIFAYTFKIFKDSELEVQVDGVIQTITTHYTVSGAGDAGGGNVTFVTAPPSADQVLIRRILPLTQLIDYITGGKFPANSHEEALDRAIMVLQQHQEVFDRSIILPPTSELTKIQIPVSGGGKAIRWNTAGTALELFDLVVGTVLQVITTEGDLIQGGTAGAPERLGIGAVGCLLHRVGAKWAALALGLRTRY